MASRGGPCQVYFLDVKLRIGDDAVYYPDLMVTREPNPGDTLVETAPSAVVEVTSRGTAAKDRREKLLACKRLSTLRAYVIIDQDRRRIDRHWIGDDGRWRDTVYASGVVPLPCPEATLTFDEIYEGVDFST